MTGANPPEPHQDDDGEHQQCDEKNQEEDSEDRVVGVMSIAVHEKSLPKIAIAQWNQIREYGLNNSEDPRKKTLRTS